MSDSDAPACRAVRFVLVQPQSGGNVGSAARALKNLGFSRLELVRPRCDPRGGEASMMAVDAADVLDAARVHPDLDSALDGAAAVIGTSARTGKHRQPHRRLDRFAAELSRLAACGELAIVFGREDHGLTDAELDRCTHLVRFPAAESYPSFNLAQAVLLVAYELRTALVGADAGDVPLPPADHASREAMYRHLERALHAIGFVSPQTSTVIMRRVRRLLGRACPSAEEVKLLRGLARQTLWTAGRAGLAIPEQAELRETQDPHADDTR